MGSNENHPRVLKELDNVTVRPLSIMFKWFWESGEATVDWNLASVPILKKGKKEDPCDYGTVSLTFYYGGNYAGAEKHLKDKAVIDHRQHGFVKGRSC